MRSLENLPAAFREGVLALIRLLDPQDNSVGGGTASALAGAMAASLLAMVGRLSVGREGMEPESFYAPLVEEAQFLAQRLLKGANEDAKAFDQVMEARRLPRNTGEQKRERSLAIQEALQRAARVPLENAKSCARILELSQLIQGRFNPSASSDFDCARFLARAGLKGCLENVRTNLPFLEDPTTVSSFKEELERLQMAVTSDGFPSEKKG